MDVEKYQEAMSLISQGGMDVTSYSSTKIVGTVTAKENQTLFTSIPYDESWTVKVDGVKVSYDKMAGAFIAVPLAAGTHEIEFTYMPRGFIYGLIITLICLLILAGLIVYRVLKHKELTQIDSKYPEESDLDDADALDEDVPKDVQSDSQ